MGNKKKFNIRLLILLTFFTNLSFFKQAYANPPTFENIRNCFLFTLQQAFISNTDPIQPLRAAWGPEIYQPNVEGGLYEFEMDVLKLFELAPEIRDIEAFSLKWGLNNNRLTEILGYYARSVFEDLSIVEDYSKVLERYKAVSRIHFIKYSDDPAAKRYSYYRQSITKKSVFEMAEEIGISESRVYAELHTLGISIHREFSKPLRVKQIAFAIQKLKEMNHLEFIPLFSSKLTLIGAAEVLINQGLSTQKTAEVLQISEGALRNFRHFTKTKKREQSWSRIGQLDGKWMAEEEMLIQLFSQKITNQEIVQRLNQIFETKSDDINYRSEGSIIAKASKMGITKNHSLGINEIYDQNYGYLKKNGDLIPVSVIPFIMDHSQNTDEWFAETLGVHLTSFRNFCVRNGLSRPMAKTGFNLARSTEGERLLYRYEQQRRAIALTTDWIEKNKKIPSTNDYGKDEGKIPFDYHQLTGIGIYSTKGQKNEGAIFSSSSEFWIAIKNECEKRNIELLLLDITIIRPSQEVIKIRQQEIIKISLQWMKENKRTIITSRDINKNQAIFHTNEKRVFGYDKNPDLNIFKSYLEFLIQLKQKGLEQGMRVLFLDADIQNPPLEIQKILQNEMIELTLEWMKKNNLKTPQTSKDFGFKIGKIPFDKGRVSNGSIFKTSSDFWIALKQKAKEKEIHISLLNVTAENATPEYKKILQEEALDLTFKWMKEKNISHVNLKDFGFREGQIPIDQNKLVYGTIFNSPSDFWIALKNKGIENGIKIYLTDMRILDFTPEIKEIFREETIDRVLDWIVLNSRIPKANDFGKGEDKIQLSYKRIMGLYEYSERGQSRKSAVFDSPELFLEALRAEAQKRNIDIEHLESKD